MREDEIREAQRALETAIHKKETTNIVDIVTRLKYGVIATESLLRSTKLGIVVGRLRTHEDKNVADLAKDTVRKWKNDVGGSKKPEQASAASASAAKSAPATSPTKASAVPNGAVKVEKPANGAEDGKTNAPRTSVTDKIPKEPTGDKVRDTSIALLYNAIALDREESTSHLFSLTKSLESEILKTTAANPSSRSPSAAYRPKIRSLFQNLKSNPSLRANLVAGHLSVQRLATMTSEEMASDKRKEENQKLQEMNIFNAQGAAPKNATTNEFQCGKCKQRKVSYYQMQTRSADEPMTTFCLCENCGNRWKF